jgi:hypothetical protein
MPSLFDSSINAFEMLDRALSRMMTAAGENALFAELSAMNAGM